MEGLRILEATGEPKLGCLGSLEMLQERNERWQGCFSSLKSQRKGGLWGQGQVVSPG